MMTSKKTNARNEAHLRDYLRIAWRGRWTILVVAVLVAGVSTVATLMTTPVFRATATVEIQPQARQLMRGEDMSGMGVQSFSWTAEDRYIKTQLEIIRSRNLAQRVLDSHQVHLDPAFPRSADPARTLIDLVAVKPREGTGIIEVSIAGPEPESITRWVNAVSDEFVARNLEEAQQQVNEVITEVSQQLLEIKKNFEDLQTENLAEAKRQGLEDPESQRRLLDLELGRLTEDQARARGEVTGLARKVEIVNDLLKGEGDLMRIEEVANDDRVKTLLAKETEVERELSRLRLTRKPGHPDYRRADSELRSIRDGLQERYRAILARINDEYAAAVDRREFIDLEISRAQTKRSALGEVATQYKLTVTDTDARQRMYDAFVARLEEINLSGSVLSNNLRVIDHAIVPVNPFFPRTVLSIAAGIILGLMLGVGLVFFLDYLDNTVKSADEVEHDFDLSMLALVPRGDAAQSSAVKEAYQTLRTSVLFSSQGRSLNTLLFTSAGPREGKSTSVAELAKTLASSGESVVLLDCDLRRPTVHTRFGITRSSGLSNYLATREVEDWKDYLGNTDIPGLSVMTCGPIPPNPPDLFNSKRFVELLEELKKSFDWVLIDSPPVISLADAVILSSLADMVAFVIRHNENDKDMIGRCLQQIRDVNPRVIGAVLNGVDLGRSGSGYYYAGYYYESGAKKKWRLGRRKGGGEPETTGQTG